MEHPANDTSPTTIADAFAQWLAVERQIEAALEAGADTQALTDRSWAIENLAVTLPVLTPQDVWALIRMTTDRRNEGPRTTQDKLVARAYAEMGEG